MLSKREKSDEKQMEWMSVLEGETASMDSIDAFSEEENTKILPPEQGLQ